MKKYGYRNGNREWTGLGQKRGQRHPFVMGDGDGDRGRDGQRGRGRHRDGKEQKRMGRGRPGAGEGQIEGRIPSVPGTGSDERSGESDAVGMEHAKSYAKSQASYKRS